MPGAEFIKPGSPRRPGHRPRPLPSLPVPPHDQRQPRLDRTQERRRVANAFPRLLELKSSPWKALGQSGGAGDVALPERRDRVTSVAARSIN